MKTSPNIEAVARALCERQLRAMATAPEDASPLVDRYWHRLAAEIEAGLIDTCPYRKPNPDSLSAPNRSMLRSHDRFYDLGSQRSGIVV
jgi:hypothetical protein